MTTDFFALCANTVPENYFWDLGVPLETDPTRQPLSFSTVTEYISGYAPALEVFFGNASFSDPNFEFIDYTWNFGDYYHNTNNTVSLSCTGIVKHTYIMPGIYTVTLTHKQAGTRRNVSFDPTLNPEYCRGKYGIRWFWDELTCLTPLSTTNEFNITWDELKCGGPYEKWWDFEEKCFQKYCKTWAWYDLSTATDPVINPVKWSETISDQEFEKKWMFEANDTICVYSPDFEFLDTIITEEQTTVKAIVEVKEIMPIANMLSVSATTGVSPFAVQLSPRNCKTGSFPIDRIDWDFGDGSPIKTVTRYAPPVDIDSSVVNTKYFISDLDDVRNFNVIHTYTRNKDTYPVFYPSLTCYSASTNSYDSCSLTIGPISFEPVITDIHLLKTRNTLKGNIYTFDINRNISLMTSNSFIKTLIPQSTTPFNKIRDSKFLTQNYFGYNGDNYPSPYNPDCNLQFIIIPKDFISTEDSTPFNLNDNLDDEGVPITTERDIVLVT